MLIVKSSGTSSLRNFPPYVAFTAVSLQLPFAFDRPTLLRRQSGWNFSFLGLFLFLIFILFYVFGDQSPSVSSYGFFFIDNTPRCVVGEFHFDAVD